MSDIPIFSLTYIVISDQFISQLSIYCCFGECWMTCWMQLISLCSALTTEQCRRGLFLPEQKPFASHIPTLWSRFQLFYCPHKTALFAAWNSSPLVVCIGAFVLVFVVVIVLMQKQICRLMIILRLAREDARVLSHHSGSGRASLIFSFSDKWWIWAR